MYLRRDRNKSCISRLINKSYLNILKCWWNTYVISSAEFQNIDLPKGSLISESILALVPLPKKGAKYRPWAENLFTVNDEKFKLSAQEQDLAPFLGQWDQSQNTLWDKATFSIVILE